MSENQPKLRFVAIQACLLLLIFALTPLYAGEIPYSRFLKLVQSKEVKKVDILRFPYADRAEGSLLDGTPFATTAVTRDPNLLSFLREHGTPYRLTGERKPEPPREYVHGAGFYYGVSGRRTKRISDADTSRVMHESGTVGFTWKFRLKKSLWFNVTLLGVYADEAVQSVPSADDINTPNSSYLVSRLGKEIEDGGSKYSWYYPFWIQKTFFNDRQKDRVVKISPFLGIGLSVVRGRANTAIFIPTLVGSNVRAVYKEGSAKEAERTWVLPFPVFGLDITVKNIELSFDAKYLAAPRLDVGSTVARDSSEINGNFFYSFKLSYLTDFFFIPKEKGEKP